MEDNQPKDEQPRGIGFYNIKSDETRYAELEPQIMGYINSSDMGINASRGQDKGWRLAKEWVEKVKVFRKNETKMSNLAAKLRLGEDENPNLIQILYAIYGEELRAARSRAQEDENPFEEQYLADISSKSEPKQSEVGTEGAAAEPKKKSQ